MKSCALRCLVLFVASLLSIGLIDASCVLDLKINRKRVIKCGQCVPIQAFEWGYVGYSEELARDSRLKGLRLRM